MKIIAKSQVFLLHNQIISETGGIQGLRDEGLLESALYAPFQLFDKEELYPTLIEKAARLGYGLIKNHAFIDGNKRIGAHVMLVFLNLNEIKIEYKQDELIKIILGVASGDNSYSDFLEWIKAHIVSN